MDKQAAIKIIRDTFEKPFDEGRFIHFSKNLVNYLDTSKNFTYQGNIIPDAFEQSIQFLKRIGKYQDADDNKIDILIARLKKGGSLAHARTMQRNFIAWYLNGSRGGDLKDAALVAFVSPDNEDWRFSLVKMDYTLVETPNGKTKIKTELTPARRWSFLVGENESSHTAQAQLLPILQDDKNAPLLSGIEKAFNIEVATREFFDKYRDLFLEVKETLENIISKDEKIRGDFAAKEVNAVDFSKKLLGQIVFLYFLQKKGWFGVERDKKWGTGPKNFLRLLFEKKIIPYQNFFNTILEPLFYEALAREHTDDFYSQFNCKIPFLNGGLFDPINNYDWVHTDIFMPDELFSNSRQTKEGDTGNGILDIFDRYNFTVKEDEPLEKEVAIDPEMLGKVFENLLEVKDRKSKGTYYTPREIVHYMCQESLINYLDTELESSIVNKNEIEMLVRFGEASIEHDSQVENAGKETKRYSYKLPESIRQNAKLIDEKLKIIRVCDPAVGSGAFPVGMMSEIVRTRNTLTTFLANEKRRTSYIFKRHAIQNCLYGVDIDPGAVEIAKLRLWLSLVVDEEDIRQIQPLPNLDYKIMQGNSLLEEYEGVKLFDEKLLASDIPDNSHYITETKEKLSVLQREYFQLLSESKLTTARKQLLEAEIKIQTDLLKSLTRPKEASSVNAGLFDVLSEAKKKASELKQLQRELFEVSLKSKKDQLNKRIETLIWELIETTLKEQSKESLLQEIEHYKKSSTRPFFLWKLYFADVFQEKGGFDVVIANPPYGFRNVLSRDEKIYFRKEKGIKFPSGDVAELFTITSLRKLVRKLGNLTFIIPKKSLYGESWREVRKLWISNGLTYLMDASKAFEKVLLEQVSFSVIKESNSREIAIGALNQDEGRIEIFGSFLLEEIFSDDLKNAQIYRGIFPKSLLGKLKNSSVTHTDRLVKGEIGISNITPHLTFEADGNYPCVKGIDIINYGLKPEIRYLKGKIAKKYLELYPDDKIIAQEIIAHAQNPFPHIIITMFYDTGRRLINDTCVEIKVLDNKLDKRFLLAYYQSTFCNWYAYNLIYNRAIRTMHFIDYYITQIPLPKCVIENSSRQKPIITLVDQILAITKDEGYLTNPVKQAEVKEYERQIDQIVYQLYGLTPEEIAVVEEQGKLNGTI